MVCNFLQSDIGRLDSHVLLDFITFSFFFFKRKTAYEVRISDCSSDVCSSDLAASPSHAIAEAEAYIATNYGSLGVIHMCRQIAALALAEEALEVRGTRLFTRLGTPVVAGAGYPCTHPDSVTAGSWIVATPALMLYRSEIFTATNRPGDLLDRGQNNLFGIAERRYLVGWDECPAPLAIEVETVIA